MCVGRIRSACLVLADLASVDVDEAKHLCKQFMANESPTNDTASLELLTSKQIICYSSKTAIRLDFFVYCMALWASISPHTHTKTSHPQGP